MPTDIQQAALQELAKREIERRRTPGDESPARQTSRLGTFLGSVGQGLTFGFGDELAAGLAAGVKAPFSERTFGEIYEDQLGQERANLQAGRDEFPGTSFAGELTGGVTQGGALLNLSKQAVRNVPNLLRLTGLGATEGAAFGVGTGETSEERLKQGILGAGLGAAATPVVAGGATIAGRGLNLLGRPLARAATNTPRRQAERIVSRAMSLDELGPVTAREELQRLGPQATLADLGENLGGLARGVTGRSSRGRTLAANFLTERQAGQQSRLLGGNQTEFRRAFNKFLTSRNAQADPLYQQARSQPLQVTERLQAILERPTVKRAMRKATRNMRDVGGGQSHIDIMDATKRELDDEIGTLLRQGKRNRARDLIQVKNDLLSEVDAQIPAYRMARETFSSEAALKDAATLGRGIFGGRSDLDAIEVAVEAMTEGERHAFRLGALRGLVDKIERTANNRNTAQKLIESPRAREVLRMVFPSEEAFEQFMAKAQAESIFTNTRNRVLSGSRTAEFQQDIQDLQRGASAVTAAFQGAADPLSAMVRVLGSLGMGDVSDETLEEVSKILFSRNLPAKQINRIAGGRTARIPTPVRQGAIAGGVGAAVTQ